MNALAKPRTDMDDAKKNGTPTWHVFAPGAKTPFCEAASESVAAEIARGYGRKWTYSRAVTA